MHSNSQIYSVFDALRSAKFPLFLFLTALLLPTYTSFEIGSLRLTTYRLYLLLAFVPFTLRILSKNEIRIIAADFLVIFSSVWASLTWVYHEGLQQGLESGGIYLLETLGAYLVGRVLVTDMESFRNLVAILSLAVCFSLVITLPECFTGTNLLGQVRLDTGQRLGLFRARGCFDHPIIYGVFCATVFSMCWCSFGSTGSRICAPLIALAAFTSVSSGAITALLVQWALLFWNRVTQNIRFRWTVLTVFFVCIYVVIDLLSNRPPMHVALSYLTLSPGTAYDRIQIWEWGFYENALKNPILGIGMSDWVRPEWRHNSSMDNYWLVLMVRHGMPCFISLAVAISCLLRSGSKNSESIGAATLFTGWSFSLVGMLIAACTVHFWNSLAVYFYFFLGVGAWFSSKSTENAGDQTT